EEVWFALDALTAGAKKVDPALVAALKDKSAATRAAAACFVGRGGSDDEKKAVRELLTDPDAEVRLRAAQGLLAGGDGSGAPARMARVGDGWPVRLAWQAEELLTYLAGKEWPDEVLGAADAKRRAACKEAWEQWLKKRGGAVDAAGALLSTRRPGLVLVVGGF